MLAIQGTQVGQIKMAKVEKIRKKGYYYHAWQSSTVKSKTKKTKKKKKKKSTIHAIDLFHLKVNLICL